MSGGHGLCRAERVSRAFARGRKGTDIPNAPYFGEAKASVCTRISGRVQCIDFCIHHIVAALNVGGIRTVASCCDHGKMKGNIILADGRTLIIQQTPRTCEEWGRSVNLYLARVASPATVGAAVCCRVDSLGLGNGRPAPRKRT